MLWDRPLPHNQVIYWQWPLTSGEHCPTRTGHPGFHGVILVSFHGGVEHRNRIYETNRWASFAEHFPRNANNNKWDCYLIYFRQKEGRLVNRSLGLFPCFNPFFRCMTCYATLRSSEPLSWHVLRPSQKWPGVRSRQGSLHCLIRVCLSVFKERFFKLTFLTSCSRYVLKAHLRPSQMGRKCSPLCNLLI